MKAVELFSGCGGLASGLHKAGFEPVLLAERNAPACTTLRGNWRDWKVFSGDVRELDYSDVDAVDLVAGGPPCQPFSIGGKGRGSSDERDMWPEATRAVREVWPRAFVFENVKGILRKTFSDYLDMVVMGLSRPSAVKDESETFSDYTARLRGMSPEYGVTVTLVNAADYGAPQKRHRVLFVGFRAGEGDGWSFPDASHSEDRLLWDQYVTGEYWDRHGLPRREAPVKLAKRVSRLVADGCPETAPWVTVRDALSDLPDPRLGCDIQNHVFQPGARVYPGHTGSPLDEPAKALKAGAHGVPGGENMAVLDDGSVRYFTVRESARLQGFPDDYVFTSVWSESMRQLGNAVPVQLAEAVGHSVSEALR